MSGDFHLAQSNLACMRAPMDNPVMQGFVEKLEPLNALADGSPGFVWRMQDVKDDATAIRAFDNELILFNMSVWEHGPTVAKFTFQRRFGVSG